MGEGKGCEAAVWVSRRSSSGFRGQGGGRGHEQVAPEEAGSHGPYTKTPRVWREGRRGVLAGCPWTVLALVLLLLGVLHLINDSVQDGWSCWNLPPLTSASSLLLLTLFLAPPRLPRPHPVLGANCWSWTNWLAPDWQPHGRPREGTGAAQAEASPTLDSGILLTPQ